MANIRSVYSDSSDDDFDDPKVETIVEMVTRIWVRSLQKSKTEISLTNR